MHLFCYEHSETMHRRTIVNRQLAGSVRPPTSNESESYWDEECETMMDIFCFTFVGLLMIFAFAVILFAALPWNWHYWIEGMEE